MENNINLTTAKSPTTSARPISNNITQFLISPTAASQASPLSTTTATMNTTTPTAAPSAISTSSSTAAPATRSTPLSTTTKVNTSTPATAASAKLGTPSSAASAIMNKSSIINPEKKNCKIKKTNIDDDIEMFEEASDEEQENVVPELVTPSDNQQPSSSSTTSGRRGNVNDAIDITADNDADDIVPNNPDTSGGGSSQSGALKKMKKIKTFKLDDDVEMVESEDEEDALAEPINTAETLPVLQRIDAAAESNDSSQITTPIARDLNNSLVPERSESLKSNDGADNHEGSSSRPSAPTRGPRRRLPPLYTPNVQQLQHVTTDAQVLIADTYIRERSETGNSTGRADNNDEASSSRTSTSSSSRFPRTRTPAPNSRHIERRKLQPDQYKFGVTRTNVENRRIIVPVENDPRLVHEYTYSHGNSWCCRLCATITKNKPKGPFAILNDDGTFNAIVHHVCQPITVEASAKEQERIKAKYSRKRNAQGASVPADDNASSSAETFRTPRSQAVNREVDYLQDDFNQSDGTSRQVLVRGRRSNNGTPMSLREVPRSQWEFGFNKAGQKEKRIIVFESNDRTHATEYGIYEYQIRCLGCNRKNHSYNHGRFDSEKELLLIPISHVCAPRLYSEIEEEQKLFVAKTNEKSARSFGSSRSKRRRMDNNESMRQKSEVPANVTSSTDADNGINSNDFDQQPPSPPSTVNSQQVPAAELQNITPSPPLCVQSDLPTNEHLSTVRFYSPCGSFFDRCCGKLGIKYSREVGTLWTNIIKVDDFNLNSIPQNVYQILDEEMSGFAALSLLLTASENSALTIKCNLNTYVMENSVVIGEMVRQDLSRSTNPKLLENFSAKNPTEIHFVAMTRLFNCRFAIFKDGSCKRYGNWNPSTEYVPIFLLEFKNGKYSPIISF